ncbi:glycosyltransferase family 4 protein [Lentibacillus sp. Marseille-P4043]|uniref:glycosyltransferase family 4 protein n=1 Tax=Lentibacillus sp. Marseille-P4043 TaxID=2040293 RepID=UPI001F221A5E|nr:glycosyltransferase [Lentibacillus sp. Marseille-P4043]
MKGQIHLRVLHISYGSPMIELSKGLQLKGIQSTSCHFDEHPFNFKPDLCLNLNLLPQTTRRAKINQFLQKSIQAYDIFHFHFGETFFPDKKDLEILKRAGKKMVVHHHGSDVRLLSVAQKNNPYVRVKPEWTEEKITNNLSILSKYIDHAIVQDYELAGYISDSYKYVHVIPHAIDLNQFKPQYPPMNNTAPLVVHAPTKRNLKGTESIIEAVNQLKDSGLSFDFKLIEGMNHQETMNLLAAADIVIDQLQIGSYGYLSSEAMALGKPVICYIREDLKAKYPKELPIVHANPDTITTVLRDLINHPNQWKNLGVRGRTYVYNYHRTQKVINQYVDIYRKL